MGGGNYGSGSTQGSILSRGYGYSNIAINELYDLYYKPSLLQPWSYKTLQTYILSEGAKMDDDFLKGVPAVIDVTSLNLPVLQVEPAATPEYFVIRSLK
jgi:hypothetical protein